MSVSALSGHHNSKHQDFEHSISSSNTSSHHHKELPDHYDDMEMRYLHHDDDTHTGGGGGGGWKRYCVSCVGMSVLKSPMRDLSIYSVYTVLGSRYFSCTRSQYTVLVCVPSDHSPHA